MTRTGPHEFTAEETSELLGLLDQRLRERGLAAAIFVVGGAALAATGVRSDRLTEDVDARRNCPQIAHKKSANFHHVPTATSGVSAVLRPSEGPIAERRSVTLPGFG
ncbi:MAG TPA: hypothetical protein VFJ19_15815 [Nocardioidaceae bacterium]|nr:hypothetical protein [Nocardioidaceae bacterium]